VALYKHELKYFYEKTRDPYGMYYHGFCTHGKHDVDTLKRMKQCPVCYELKPRVKQCRDDCFFSQLRSV
jgi:hypothetical protein